MSAMLAIINPAAGGGRGAPMVHDALEGLRRRGLEIEERTTERAGHATEIARAAYADGYRDFIAVGGDGTSHEVINGLDAYFGVEAPSERCRLGLLPMGTGNSFLRDFTDRGAEYTIEALADGRRRGCDIVRIHHDGGLLYFINLFSCGFVADVCTVANTRFKSLGPAGYGAGVVACLAGLRSRLLKLRVDGGEMWEQQGLFFSVCNSRYTGGAMMMAPFADATDGQVDVVFVGQMGRATLMRLFPRIFKGTHVHDPRVTTCRGREIELFFDAPLDVMVDGEVVRIRPTRIEVLPGAIDVAV